MTITRGVFRRAASVTNDQHKFMIFDNGGHDVEEIAPGLVLTASQPIMLLDARKNPTRPKLLATGANTDGRFIHTGRWPQNGTDKFLLMA